MRRHPFIPLLLLASILPARAADPDPAANRDAEIELQRRLDQPITLSLSKVELAEAFKQIAAAAKIALQVDPACYEFLPYGATITISTDFRQSKLRDSLEEILLPLGLQQTVSGKAVLIRPSNALARIGHRADWEELKLLQDLHRGAELKAPPAGGAGFNLTDAIRAALDGRKDLAVVISDDAANSAAALDQVRKVLPISPYRALEMYCQLTGQVWFVEAGALSGGPTGGTVRIMSQKQWIGRQLERPIQMSRKNQPLEVIVSDLTQASGIAFVPEPGLYQMFRDVSLSSNNATVRQTLEMLAGATGIAFDIRDDSILLRLAPRPGGGTGAGTAGSGGAGNGTELPAKSDPIIGHIAMPASSDGLILELYVHESDLPPELRKTYSQTLKNAVHSLQSATPAPATAPPSATAPAAPAPQ